MNTMVNLRGNPSFVAERGTNGAQRLDNGKDGMGVEVGELFSCISDISWCIGSIDGVAHINQSPGVSVVMKKRTYPRGENSGSTRQMKTRGRGATNKSAVPTCIALSERITSPPPTYQRAVAFASLRFHSIKKRIMLGEIRYMASNRDTWSIHTLHCTGNYSL